MAVFAVCSAKGSPGVTTTALAWGLTWPVDAGRRVLVVDADPAGADIAAGYLQGQSPPGLYSMAADRSSDVAAAVRGAAVALDESGARLVLPGSPGSHRGLTGVWSRLADLGAGGTGWDVVVDLGRADLANARDLMVRADLVVLVVSSSLRAVAATRPTATQLLESRTAGGHPAASVVLLVVGERRPYPVAEIAAAVGLPALSPIAWDPDAASVLCDGVRASRRFARSALIRSAAATAGELLVLLAAESVTGTVTADPGGTDSVVESAVARALTRNASAVLPRSGAVAERGAAS